MLINEQILAIMMVAKRMKGMKMRLPVKSQASILLMRVVAVAVAACVIAASLVGCAPVQSDGSQAVDVQRSADFDRGSIAVKDNQVTVTLADIADDGYSWYATDAVGMTENLDTEAEIDAVSGSVVRVYDVDASVDATVDFYYANESDASDIRHMDTLTVTSDESGNVSAVSISDSEGSSASVS